MVYYPGRYRYFNHPETGERWYEDIETGQQHPVTDSDTRNSATRGSSWGSV
jgi:hypothetical protein